MTIRDLNNRKAIPSIMDKLHTINRFEVRLAEKGFRSCAMADGTYEAVWNGFIKYKRTRLDTAFYLFGYKLADPLTNDDIDTLTEKYLEVEAGL